MADIVLAAPPIHGELAPLLTLADGLVGRGHEVTVLTGSRWRDTVVGRGLGFRALGGRADFGLEHIHVPERSRLAPGLEQFVWDVRRLFADAMPDQFEALQDLLAQDPQRVLIANSLFLGAWPVALGAPGRRPRRWVAVAANPLMLSSDDTTPFGPAPVPPGGTQRAANRVTNRACANALRPIQDHLTSMLDRLGAGPAPLVGDGIVTLPDATAALTVPGFEFHRGDAPSSLHLVGLLPPPPWPGWTPPAWWPDLDDGRPVVVVTQGTLANEDLSALVEPTVAALADLDVLVVAALGRPPTSVSGPLPANVRLTEFVPFTALLPRADVLVTNGGFGSTQQALAAGLPVVVAGTTEDKPAVAARVAAHGVGVDLGTARPSVERIREAVLGVLGDVEMQTTVAALSAVYAEHDALSAIEALAVAPIAGPD